MKRLHTNVGAIAAIVTVLVSTVAWRAASGVTPGDPVPDIDVVVEQHPGPMLHTVTDANGAFSFKLAPGSYVLRIATRPPAAVEVPQSKVRPVGATNGRMVPLPDNVVAPGGWPYALRLAETGVVVAKVGLAIAATPGGSQRTAGASVRDLEITVTIGTPGARGDASYTLRGAVETRK